MPGRRAGAGPAGGQRRLASGAKPSTWSFSRSRTSSVMKSGKYAFSTPIFLISPSNQRCTCSHIAKAHGRRM